MSLFWLSSVYSVSRCTVLFCNFVGEYGIENEIAVYEDCLVDKCPCIKVPRRSVVLSCLEAVIKMKKLAVYCTDGHATTMIDGEPGMIFV